MIQAYYTGISGIQNNSTGIDVIADNMANINTVGYRGSSTEFSNLFDSSVMGGSVFDNSVGTGVQVQAISMMQEEGVLELTDKSTDMAIRGDGWFGVEQSGEPIYTRDGTFTFDANSDLVTTDGYHVLGTMGGNIDENNTLLFSIDSLPLGEVDAQEKLRFPQTLTYPPKASTNVKFIGNLGVTDDTYTLGTSVVDTQNNKNNLTLKFQRNEEQVLPGSQYTAIATITSPDGLTTYDTQEGKIEFDETGGLVSNTFTTIDNNGSPVLIDLGEGFDGITSIDLPYAPGSTVADGTIGGELVGYEINKNAEVVATFTNGEQSSVGKIAVFHFENEQGLEKLSGTKFIESPNSGVATFRQDDEGNNINGADVFNFKLESSNVDLSYGLTELIILQRSYDANSKSITTADQMMQKALSMDA